MKLYTYFRAQEIARLRIIYDDWTDQRMHRQYQHLRDGLVARMERTEMRMKQYESRVDQLCHEIDDYAYREMDWDVNGLL